MLVDKNDPNYSVQPQLHSSKKWSDIVKHYFDPIEFDWLRDDESRRRLIEMQQVCTSWVRASAHELQAQLPMLRSDYIQQCERNKRRVDDDVAAQAARLNITDVDGALQRPTTRAVTLFTK